jgi:hypothetical protein
MGDRFRTIVDPLATAKEAPALANKVIEYLIERRIILPQVTDCTLGKEGGHPPGENVAEALAEGTMPDTDGKPLSSAAIAQKLISWGCNGVEAVSGRTIFHNFGAGLQAVRCPLCLGNQVDVKLGEPFARWQRGDDLAPQQCQVCNESSPIVEWLFDPPWAFGHLGFEFWNWPPLKRRFVQQICDILGHKVRMVAGKV